MEITENTVVKFYCPRSKCEHPHECEITWGYLPIFPECPFCVGRVQCPCSRGEDADKDSEACMSDIRRADRYQRKLERARADNYFVQIKDVDWESIKDQDHRAGCIPYVVVDKKIYFCLGLDKLHREYCDFGGRKERKDLTHLNAALREFREESREVFPQESYNSAFIQNEMCLLPYKEFNHTLLFIQIPSDKYFNSITEFNRLGASKLANTWQEMSTIKWLNEKEFQKAFFNRDRVEGEPIKTWKFVSDHLSQLGINYRLFRGRLIHKTKTNYRRISV